MMNTLRTWFLLGALTGTAAVSFSCKPPLDGGADTQRAWNASNDPVLLRSKKELERRFSKLPDEGKVKSNRRPWHSTYWPSQMGGISARWNHPVPFGFTHQPPSFFQARALTLREKAMLSPAEKYDLYMGNYGYPLTMYEKNRTSPFDADWEGLCHGVAAASLVFPEPKPIVVKNPSGIEVPFGSADLKGLLSLYMGYIASNDVNFVGERCNRPVPVAPGGMDVLINVGSGFGRESLSECEDVNAGTFHLLLANLVGRQRESFVADKSRGPEVWNYAVLEFSSRVTGTQGPGPKAAPGTVRENVVETVVTYAASSLPAWKEKAGLVEESVEKVTYRYTVELNRNGEVIGGEWLVNEFPDFLWRQAKPKFDFYFEKLGELIDRSENSKFDDDLTFYL
jgi:hypothetical protein